MVLEIWLLAILEKGVRLFLQLLLGRVFGGSQFWFAKENEFDSTENPPHTLQGLVFNPGHVCGKDCDLWTSLGFFSCSQEEAL